MPTVIELSDLPRCHPNESIASTLTSRTDAFVAYDTNATIEDEHADHDVALLRFRGCRRLIAGGPNDEALGRHPLYPAGLVFYKLQEVLDSPWLREVSTVLDSHGRPDRLSRCRHFVLAFKEDCVDVAAESVELVGTFPTHAEALAFAWNTVF